MFTYSNYKRLNIKMQEVYGKYTYYSKYYCARYLKNEIKLLSY